MISIDFTKMQGLGNDFVVLEGPVQLGAEEVREICDRRFGIGADGVLIVTSGDPIAMEYFNADGSVAEMCGNGLRCVARYAYDLGWTSGPEFEVSTHIGNRRVRVSPGGNLVEVELGVPRLDGARTIEDSEFALVSVGNPHAVVFVEDPSLVDVAGIGTSAQSEFPEGVNVEFVSIDGNSLTMRVWERGVGETLACGTGMVAAVAAAADMHQLSLPVDVSVAGGSASVDLRDGVAWLRGPADYVFTGSVAGR